MTEDLWEKLLSHGTGLPTISNRDRATGLLTELDVDIESQLFAIKCALANNRNIEAKTSARHEELEKFIDSYDGGDEEYQRYLVDEWVDSLHFSTYENAAHSMSAIGLLAPFIESLFISIFTALRKKKSHSPINNIRLNCSENIYWNPKFFFEGAKYYPSLPKGIDQLSESLGLKRYFPEDLLKTLEALFHYRNNMFHNGFLWPPDKSEKFANQIESKNWPKEWFELSKYDGKPWIIYMSQTFIDHCFLIIDKVLDSTGNYLSDDQKDLKIEH